MPDPPSTSRIKLYEFGPKLCRQDLPREEVIYFVNDETRSYSNVMQGSIVNKLKIEGEQPSQIKIQGISRSLCHPHQYAFNFRQKKPCVSDNVLCKNITSKDDSSLEWVNEMENGTFLCSKFPAEWCMLELV